MKAWKLGSDKNSGEARERKKNRRGDDDDDDKCWTAGDDVGREYKYFQREGDDEGLVRWSRGR